MGSMTLAALFLFYVFMTCGICLLTLRAQRERVIVLTLLSVCLSVCQWLMFSKMADF